MSEMDKLQKYLKKTLERLEAKLINSLPDEHYQKAILGADFLEIGDLIEQSTLNTPYVKGQHLDRAEKAYIDNVSVFIKAKRSFNNGEIQKTIELLFLYHFQIGQIQQNITEEDGFAEIASLRSKAGTDKRYVKHQLIRAEACQLLRGHRPEGGWPNRPSAAKKILPYLESFVNKIDRDEGRIYFEPENIGNVLAGWMEDKKNEVSVTFEETASQKWLSQHVKNKPL